MHCNTLRALTPLMPPYPSPPLTNLDHHSAASASAAAAIASATAAASAAGPRHQIAALSITSNPGSDKEKE